MKNQSIPNKTKNLEKQKETIPLYSSSPTKGAFLEEEENKIILEILAAPTKSTDFSIHYIGKTLKNLREEKELSLEETEKAIGLSSSYISMLETGFKNKSEEEKLSLESIRRYSEFLGLDLFQLMFEVKRTGLEENKEIEKKTKKAPSQVEIIPSPLGKDETIIPTLDLFIQINEEEGGIRLDFLLHSESLGYIYESFPGKLIRGYNSIEEFQNKVFQQIKEAGRQTNIIAKLKNLGTKLYKQLFPSRFKQKYRKIRQSRNLSLRIISNETWIPWELLCPIDEENPEEIIDDGFLCIYFQLTRWISKTPVIPRLLQIKKTVLVETGKKENHESIILEQLLSGGELKNISPDSPTAQQFLDIMESEKVELWHFNVTKEESNPDRGIVVSFQDRSTLNVNDLYGEIQDNMRKSYPFIFFNDYAEKDGLTPSPLKKWAPTFLKHIKCCVFIAPTWSVDPNISSDFFTTLCEKIAAGFKIGRAVWETRQTLYQNNPENPSFLAYSIFAHPDTHVTFEKRAYTSSTNGKETYTSPTKKEEKVNFHSGERLKLFRKLKGLSQTELLDQKGFPRLSETRSLRRWESKGIPNSHIEKVTQYCDLDAWIFLDERITKEQFKMLVLYPGQQGQIKKELDKTIE